MNTSRFYEILGTSTIIRWLYFMVRTATGRQEIVLTFRFTGAHNNMTDAPAKAPRNSGRIFKTCKWGMIQGDAKTILDKFRLCKEVGFDGMELTNPVNFGEPGAERSPEQNDAKFAEILAASRETDMPIHGLVNILGNRKAHIAAPDEATRDKG